MVGGVRQALEARMRALRESEEEMANVEIIGPIPGMTCQLCRSQMMHKKNERGPFAGCASYPTCKGADYAWRPANPNSVAYGVHKDGRFAATCKGCGAAIAVGQRYYHESKGVTKCLACAPETQAGAQAAAHAAAIATTGQIAAMPGQQLPTGYTMRADGTILVPPMGNMPAGWRVLAVDPSGNVTMAPPLPVVPPIPQAQQMPLQVVDFAKHLKTPQGPLSADEHQNRLDAQRARAQVAEAFPGAAVRVVREDPASMAAELLRISLVLLKQAPDGDTGVRAARQSVAQAMEEMTIPF